MIWESLKDCAPSSDYGVYRDSHLIGIFFFFLKIQCEVIHVTSGHSFVAMVMVASTHSPHSYLAEPPVSVSPGGNQQKRGGKGLGRGQ